MLDAVVFDVNETLLDVSALDPPFERVFGTPGVRTTWFGALLQDALTTALVETYVPFGTLAARALDAVAADRGHDLADADRDAILGAVRELPPHDDAVDALGTLRDAGFRLVALSNGSPDVLPAQLDHAGLADHFHHVLSADAAKRLKPAPAPYALAARTLGLTPEAIAFVAAHAWDTAGASVAGFTTVFVDRPGQLLSAALPSPDHVAPNLRAAADLLVGLRAS
jgi:2-haloacid dehalogenase